MVKVDLETENAKHIAILNDEMGKIQGCIADFKQDNAVEHARIFESLKNQNIYISDIKQSITKLGWGLASSVIILIISIIITNLFK